MCFLSFFLFFLLSLLSLNNPGVFFPPFIPPWPTELKKEKLTTAQQIGVKYFEELNERIPREEMHQLKDVIFDAVSEVYPDVICEVCGSYRRHAATSGDIDILMTHKEFRSSDKAFSKQGSLGRIVERLKKIGFVTDVLSLGDLKFMGVCKLPDKKEAKHRRIDIRFWPYDQYPCALLYFTGSDQFNIDMRKKAIDLNLHLNEYGIQPVGENGVLGDPLPVASEKDIFDYVDMKFVEPQNR
eukprot:m.247402 g.247402  ORF g.247402 m.247402 type:complete len:241 (+) comp22598_c0_seq5:1280-2002(+)